MLRIDSGFKTKTEARSFLRHLRQYVQVPKWAFYRNRSGSWAVAYISI